MYYYIPPKPIMPVTTECITNKQVTIHNYTDVPAKVTAYTVSYESCGKIDGITASGKRVTDGMIAAPSSVPFGTVISIDGKDLVVEDRGGAIVIQKDGTYNIDYYVSTRKKAIEYGVKYTTIRIQGLKSTTSEEVKQWVSQISYQKKTTGYSKVLSKKRPKRHKLLMLSVLQQCLHGLTMQDSALQAFLRKTH